MVRSLQLEIDGELRQQGGYELMMYKPEQILAGIQRFMSLEDGDIIMWGQGTDHQVRVTFYNIRPEQFDWKYEFSASDDGTLWTEVARMKCLRPGMEPAVLNGSPATLATGEE
mgnify:FL=1